MLRIALILFAVSGMFGADAFAQDDPVEAARQRAAEEAQRRAAERRAAEAEKQERERGIKALNDFLVDGHIQMQATKKAWTAQEVRKQQTRVAQFRSALTTFEGAKQELSSALGFKAKLKEPAQKMTKSAAVFLDYVKRATRARPSFNSSEFKDFTPTELGWEALTTAERLSPALVAMIEAEAEFTVDIRYLKFLAQLQAELRRLQWITQRLK